ncbi:MAG: hypothetical protein ACM3X4_01275 [Ignavibacteriales bacterium]
MNHLLSLAEFMDKHEGFILGVLTLLYAVATCLLVRETRRSVEELRQARVEQNRPYVSLSIQDRADGLPVLAVQNRGLTAAVNIRIALPSSIIDATEEVLKEAVVSTLASGALMLAPGQSIMYALCQPGRFEPLKALGTVTVPMEYSGLGGTYRDAVVLDFRAYAPALISQYDVAGVLWKIHEDLKERPR